MVTWRSSRVAFLALGAVGSGCIASPLPDDPGADGGVGSPADLAIARDLSGPRVVAMPDLSLTPSPDLASFRCDDTVGLQPGAPWAIDGNGRFHNGRSPNHGPASVKLHWTSSELIQVNNESLAIAADGTVYSGSDPLVAYRGSDGKELWSYSENVGFAASPAIGADGTLYYGTELGNVVAFDGTSGKVKWSVNLGSGGGAYSPSLGPDGTVYVDSATTGLHALDGATGKEKWSDPTVGNAGGCPAIACDGTLYESDDGWLHAIDGQTGARRWDLATKPGSFRTPSIGDDGTILLAGERT